MPQAIDEHRGDATALVGLAGFLLDDRGQGNELVRRPDRNVRIAPLPDFRKHAFLRLLHALDYLVARGAARKFVGFRQQRALARHLLYRARKDIVVRKPGRDLFGGQAFGNRDGVLHYLAFDHDADDIAQTGVLLKCVFAGLEFGARLQRKHAADERPAIVVDHAFTLQDIGNVGHSGARRNIDDLVFLQRAGRLDLLFAVNICGAHADHRDQHDGDDRVADHDEWIAGALGPLWRRRNLLGLQRRARAPG